MPYIKQEERRQYDKILDQMPINGIINKGHLEYCITKLLNIYMRDKEVRYSTLHDCVYGCIHAGEEFKRIKLDAREDEAIKLNGVVC